jgi:hypothetical protein
VTIPCTLHEHISIIGRVCRNSILLLGTAWHELIYRCETIAARKLGTRCAWSKEERKFAGSGLLSSHPCPTCCTGRAIPANVRKLQLGVLDCRTLGNVTFGMMTVFNAEGASFLGAFMSPPGWYWYLPSPPPDSQGLLFSAWATLRSEEALVGDRAVTVSHCCQTMDAEVCDSVSRRLTKVPSSEAENTTHDGKQDLFLRSVLSLVQ